ncbi:MAG: CopL family metal-binding regulatory protein [Rudaea sp.]|nr:CopL family metal-binding regulatory protein [Rudaea sp.]
MQSVSAIALRILLSLALVLNGMGSAVASVQMAHSEADRAGAASETHAPPCGEHHDASVPGDHQHPSATHHDHRSVPDCCKSSACRCACAHGSAWAMAFPAQVPPFMVYGLSTPFTTSEHLSPTLPHLIRPPIS